MNESEAKQAFIASMANKYDYAAYRDFCISNNYEVMSFYVYALTIEPSTETVSVSLHASPVTPADIDVAHKVPMPCCGGGEVR